MLSPARPGSVPEGAGFPPIPGWSRCSLVFSQVGAQLSPGNAAKATALGRVASCPGPQAALESPSESVPPPRPRDSCLCSSTALPPHQGWTLLGCSIVPVSPPRPRGTRRGLRSRVEGTGPAPLPSAWAAPSLAPVSLPSALGVPDLWERGHTNGSLCLERAKHTAGTWRAVGAQNRC